MTDESRAGNPPTCPKCGGLLSEITDVIDPNVARTMHCDCDITVPPAHLTDPFPTDPAEDCELCDGCGEIETQTKDGKHWTVPCPTCVSRELRAEIVRLTELAGLAADGADLAPAAGVEGGKPLRVTLDGAAWASVAEALRSRNLLDLFESDANVLVTLTPVAFEIEPKYRKEPSNG